MILTFREKVEEVVRDILGHHPANSQPMPRDPIQQPSSTVRQELFAQLVSLREQQEQELPPLRAEAARLEGMLNEVLRQAEELSSQLTNVHGQEFVRNLQLSTAMDRVTANLQASASPLILDFLVKMNTEFDRLTRLKPQHSRGTGERNLLTMVKPKFVYSDFPMIRRRVQAVLAARKRAEELKTIDRSDSELAEELESLREGLPVIDGEWEEVIG